MGVVGFPLLISVQTNMHGIHIQHQCRVGIFPSPRKQSKMLVGDEKSLEKRFIHRINGLSGYRVLKATNCRTAGALLGSQRSQKALILPQEIMVNEVFKTADVSQQTLHEHRRRGKVISIAGVAVGFQHFKHRGQ